MKEAAHHAVLAADGRPCFARRLGGRLLGGDDQAEDLGEAQGDDGQVVALEAQARQAHEETEDAADGPPSREGPRA